MLAALTLGGDAAVDELADLLQRPTPVLTLPYGDGVPLPGGAAGGADLRFVELAQKALRDADALATILQQAKAAPAASWTDPSSLRPAILAAEEQLRALDAATARVAGLLQGAAAAATDAEGLRALEAAEELTEAMRPRASDAAALSKAYAAAHAAVGARVVGELERRRQARPLEMRELRAALALARRARALRTPIAGLDEAARAAEHAMRQAPAAEQLAGRCAAIGAPPPTQWPARPLDDGAVVALLEATHTAAADRWSGRLRQAIAAQQAAEEARLRALREGSLLGVRASELQTALSAEKAESARLRAERDEARKERDEQRKEVARREQWLDGFAGKGRAAS